MNLHSLSGVLTIILIIGLAGQNTSATNVVDTDCATNGDTDCTDAHAECDTNKKCKCSDGYIVDTNDESACASDPAGQTNNQQTTKTNVVDTDCATNGDADCTDAHAECDSTTSKCKCSDGYIVDTNDQTACVLDPASQTNNQPTTKTRVSAVGCKDGGNECNSIDNAVCDVPHSLCKCDAGFLEGKTDTSKCVKILGADCTGNSACDGDGNSMCTNKVCVCADTFGQKNNVCTKNLNSTTCTAGTECNALPNAECDTATKICKCSAGFKMNVNTCEAENAGVAITTTFAVFVLPVVLAMKEAVKTLM